MAVTGTKPQLNISNFNYMYPYPNIVRRLNIYLVLFPNKIHQEIEQNNTKVMVCL